MAPILSLLALGLFAIDGALAHPGHNVAEEAAERGQFLRKRQPNSVRNCAAKLKARGHVEKSIARRQAMADKARIIRNLPHLVSRDYASAVNISHESDLNVTLSDDETLLFEDNSSCVLGPEVTQGPYYVDGELIRSNIVEDQGGIPLWLDVQIVDTSSCEPVPDVYMEAWHCNATGVYSGVIASNNGNSNDTSNLDATFLRGIVETDANGVAQFETIFPGHYTGRANHIHVMTHNVNDTTVRANGTILGSNFTTTASHVGQIFFDQDLITQVEETEYYSTNTQELTTNADDSILSQETAEMDPIVEWVYVNPDNLEDGILAWISIGIDPTADSEITSTATIYEDGGVTNENAGAGGGSGAPPS